MTDILLKPGRERSLHRRHPWLFSGAVREIKGSPASGETVTLRAHDGQFLARAAYSPKSQIAARAWTWDDTESVDEAFIRGRLARAIGARGLVPGGAFDSAAQRLVYAESDGVPGLIVDRYGTVFVLQSLTAGAEFWKTAIVQALVDLYSPKSVYERSDVDVRGKEGLTPAAGLLAGDPIPERVEIMENGRRFLVDVQRGHKTGFYLDQRENRTLLEGFAPGRHVLNCFAYTGGFSLAALRGGALDVVSVESGAEAIALGRENLRLNGFADDRAEWVEGDVFQVLRGYRDQGRRFDLIVLDPPKFAQSAAQVEKAGRGYKDINWLAFRLLNPGGLLFTFSCSGAIDPELFQKIVAGAALDANVDAQIIRRLGQAPDHPINLHFPESEYLKGLVCRVMAP